MMVMIHIIKKESNSYLHSPYWNNNSPQIFTGKYDYDNKWALDKNMRTVQYFMNQEVNYKSNFNYRKLAFLQV